MKKKYAGLLISAGLAAVPAMASAAGPGLSDILVNSGITAAGYVDGSYEAFFNKSNDEGVLLHEFDNNTNSFVLNQAALTLSYLPSDGFGGAVNVIAGEDAKSINGSYGDSTSVPFSLTQAYLQWAHGNFTIIGGRFVTLAGAEVIDDTKNSNVSRSLLFTNLEPLVHTGVRASYKLNDMVTGYLGLNNSAFQSFPGSVFFIPTGVTPVAAGADTDKHKTIEAGSSFTFSKTLSLAVVDYYGPDGTGPTQVKDNYLDAVVTFQATDALQLVLNGDYVRVIAHGGGGSTYGLAGYASYQVTPKIKGSVRGEYLRASASGTADEGEGGIETFKGGGDVMELTATVDYSPVTNFDVLGEIRDDYAATGSLGGIFQNGTNDEGDAFRKSQPEILIKAIWKFGTPVPTT